MVSKFEGGKREGTIETHVSSKELSKDALDGEGKGKTPMTMDDERGGNHKEKIDNTFQFDFSSIKTIADLAKQSGKEPCNGLT